MPTPPLQDVWYAVGKLRASEKEMLEGMFRVTSDVWVNKNMDEKNINFWYMLVRIWGEVGGGGT